MTNTTLITRTKSGAKLHSSYKGSSISMCGHRTPMALAAGSRGMATAEFCGHCFGDGPLMAQALCRALRALVAQ